MGKLKTNRQKAIDEGKLTYEGKPHKVCGTTEKYVKKKQCVLCSKTIWQPSLEVKNKYRIKTKNKNREKIVKENEKLEEYYIKGIISRIKSKSKRENILFNLKKEDIIIPKYCPILDLELKYNIRGTNRDSSPSIDRIIPENGYVKNNIIVVSHKANRIKNDATFNEVGKVYNFYKKHFTFCDWK